MPLGSAKLPLDVQNKIDASNFFLRNLIGATKLNSSAWTDVDEHLCYLDGFLFEIVSCKNAFLSYLNKITTSPLEDWQVTEKALLRVWNEKKISKQFIDVVKELIDLKENKDSWLHTLSEYRNITTHRRLLPRFYEIQFGVKPLDDGGYELTLDAPLTIKAGDQINVPIIIGGKADAGPRKLLIYRDPAEYEREQITDDVSPNLADTIDAVEYCKTTFEQMNRLITRLYEKTLVHS